MHSSKNFMLISGTVLLMMIRDSGLLFWITRYMSP